MKKEVIGIIPARYASTRFPGKPLIDIKGKTLIQRTYENALRATSLKSIVVATDDQRIYDHVQGFGGQVVMTSPHWPTGTDRLAEVLLNEPKLNKADIVVNIQGDEPCLDPAVIDAVSAILINDPEAVMSTAMTPLKNEADVCNPNIVKCVVDTFGTALYFSRAMIPYNKTGKYDPATSYFRHLGIYAYRPSFLSLYQQLPATPLQLAEDLEQLKVLEHGFRIKVALVEEMTIGVDTPQDIQKVEQWLCRQNTYS